MPRISIITINRNNKEGLEKTILSVQSQQYKNYEHLIIDGKSNDGSLDVIEKWKHQFSYFVSEADNGIYDAMNKGILAANGEYCIFLNSGDIFLNKKVLEKIFSYQFDADILYGDVILSYGNGKLERKSYPKRLGKCFLAFETICHQTTIYRRKYIQEIGGYDLDYRICADYALLARSVFERKRIEHVPVFISVYDMTGTANDPKNFSLIMKERTKIQSKYYSEEELQIALEAEPVYRDWLRWKSSWFINFYEKVQSRFARILQSLRKFFSLNTSKQLVFLFICFFIRRFGWFDEEFYRNELKVNKMELPLGIDLLHHYLRHGYYVNLEPSSNFRGSLISYYYNLNVGRIKNPLLFLFLKGKIQLLLNSPVGIIEIENKKDFSFNWESFLVPFKKLLADTKDNTYHFIFTHSLGGGSNKALELILTRYPFRDNPIFVSPSREFKDLLILEFRGQKKKISIKQSDLSNLFEYLVNNSFSIDIRINHLLGMEFLIPFLKSHQNFIKEIFLHDYNFICPFIFLSPKEVYCGLPSSSKCNECLSVNGKENLIIENYRREFAFLFDKEHIKIIAPSNSVIKHFKKVFPEGNYVNIPHEDLIFPKSNPLIKNEKDYFHIGILGHLNLHKGVRLVEHCLEQIKNKKLKIKIICIGSSEPKLVSTDYEETGNYEEADLDSLIKKNNLDLIWFPVRIPETYSFTLSSALTSALPLYVPDIGSFPERTNGRASVLRFSYSEKMTDICEKLFSYVDKHRVGK